MFDKQVNTNETGDTALKELYEQRGYLLSKLYNAKTDDFSDSRLQTDLEKLIERTENLIKKHLNFLKITRIK